MWTIVAAGMAGMAYVSLRGGVFTTPVRAEFETRTVAAAARDDGIIDIPEEAPTLALALAASRTGDMIRLAPGTYEGGARIAHRAIRLVGAGAGATTLTGAGAGPVLEVAGPANLEVAIEGMTIKGAPLAAAPGVLVTTGRVELRGVVLTGNEGSGAVVQQGARLTMVECALMGNRNGVAGGGVRNNGGTVLAVECTFSDNIAVTYGGAIFSQGGSVDAVACRFEGNATTSGAFGGAVYGERAALHMVGSDFVRNESREAGGAVYLQEADAAIERCSFAGNLADGAWAVYGSGGRVTMNASLLCGDAEQLLGGSVAGVTANSFDSECFQDCNQNGVSDADEIARGWSQDADGNGVPDDCDFDCNSNGLPDAYEIASGFAQDANGNGIIDTCEIRMGLVPDADNDLVPDDVQNAATQHGMRPAPANAPVPPAATPSLPAAGPDDTGVTPETRVAAPDPPLRRDIRRLGR